jgi:signal transduction histidine kinase
MSALLASWGLQAHVAAAIPAQTGNPITRIARIFDPQLVHVEDRVTWLDREVSSLAQHCEFPLKVGLGYRGARSSKTSADPSITLDLQREMPIDQIFLVPAQREFLEDPGVFPRRFTLELSNRPDFGQRTILYTSGNTAFPPPNGIPAAFKAKDSARFVRLTVQEGHNKGTPDLFGLSEFVVISNGEPVSFGAAVSTVGGLDVPGIWYPGALTDGRTQLGIWQNGRRTSREPGDEVRVSNEQESTTWTVQLGADQPVDRIVLYPYQVNRSFETSIFPESLVVRIRSGERGESAQAMEWNNPLPGSNHMAPLVIPMNGQQAGTLTVTATRPWTMGDRKIHALSEIEVWSKGRNLARNVSVERFHAGQTTRITSLTDGFSSEKQICPVGIWLNQLTDRGRIERELGALRAQHRQLASRSELNATWGSAVILGLTFLIPVFIVERRRLMSKEQLDQIRKRIASDLHDDIGSNLGSISLIARTARKDLARLHGPEEIAEDLGEVETIARESSLAMRDIVWLLERRQDSIGDLVQRMRETAGRLLREIHFTLECESSKTAAKLSLDAKRHLFLFYKEAIHNVLKHSHANRVSIRLWDEDDKLALEILDNGIGIPAASEELPPAVAKLEDRARVLDGLLQVASSKENGTCIRLLVKRSHLTTHPSLS